MLVAAGREPECNRDNPRSPPQISNMKVEREKALEHKQRMSRMMEDKENFVSKITAARSFIYEVKT